jgi:hypothetical protein
MFFPVQVFIKHNCVNHAYINSFPLHSACKRFIILLIRILSLCWKGPGGSMSYVVGLPNNSYKPITDTRGFASGFANYKIRRTRFAVSSDKVFSCLPMVGGSLRFCSFRETIVPSVNAYWPSVANTDINKQ